MTNLNKSYGLNNPLQDNFPVPVEALRAPTAADTNYPIGQVWVRTSTNQAWILTSFAAGVATWALSSPGASDVDTLTGDAGGAISPAAGNITLAGGTNITTTGAVSTITFDLDAAITLATSVTSPLYTAGAGVDVLVTAPAGQDIVLRMGDAAGVTGVSFESSTPAEVFRIDSTGVMTLAGLTVTGAFTQTGGVANIGSDAAANAINIGTGAAAKTITVGNSSGATSIVLNCGTGALNIGTNAIAHTITIGNITGATAVNVNSGTGACAWTTTNGSFGLVTGTGAINLGADAAAKTITIGNITGATAVNVNSGSGACAWTTTNGSFGVVTGTGAINIGTDAVQKTLTIGNITGNTAVNINTGTGGSTYTTTNGTLGFVTGTGAINIGADAAAKTITIGNATGATSVVVNGGTGAMSFGANATDHTTTLGSTNGVSASTLQSGTGALTVNGGGILDIDCVGAMQINSSGGTIGLGNDAVAQNINIGTGAAARTITIGNVSGATSVVVNNGTGAASFGAAATDHTTTIGSTTGASSTVLQAGTSGFTITGTINDFTSKFATITGDRLTFTASPILQSNLNTGAAPTGATSDVNLMQLENASILTQFVIGAGQTIIAPRMSANGLLISGDLTASEGYEYSYDATRDNSKFSFTIGTSPAFYLQWRFVAADVSGCEPAFAGFRKTQANQTVGNLSAYTDYVCIGLDNLVSTAKAVIQTQLNTGGVVSTDTTDGWLDNAAHTVRINVSAAGVVTFLLDGIAPSVTQAFTFDNGDVVHPFFRHEFGLGAPGAINWVSMECGYQ